MKKRIFLLLLQTFLHSLSAFAPLHSSYYYYEHAQNWINANSSFFDHKHKQRVIHSYCARAISSLQKKIQLCGNEQNTVIIPMQPWKRPCRDCKILDQCMLLDNEIDDQIVPALSHWIGTMVYDSYACSRGNKKGEAASLDYHRHKKDNNPQDVNFQELIEEYCFYCALYKALEKFHLLACQNTRSLFNTKLKEFFFHALGNVPTYIR